jgi:serine/threonine-protein kinase
VTWHPVPPSLLVGRYELTGLLARGGMAQVWRAHDRVLHRPVAVKVAPGDGGPPVEARRHAAVRDGHVVTVLDAGSVVDPAGAAWGFLVLELADGGSLAGLLADRRVLTVGRALGVLREVALGLGAVHRAGIVHRDVKPGNVLLHADGRALLTDFGISRWTGEPAGTAAGEIRGTLPYLPPEQVRGGAAVPAGDVYALGVLGHELLTGRRAVQPLPAGVPADLAALLVRAVDDDPDRRPADGDELAVALAAVGPVPPSAVPGPADAGAPTRVLAPPARARHPRLAAVALAGCVLLGGEVAAALPDGGAAPVAPVGTTR